LQVSFAQTDSPGSLYPGIIETARQAYRDYPLLRNGIVYEYPYYNSKGHPFLFDNNFHTGSVDYGKEFYNDVPLKYDIYNQQIIIQINLKGELVQLIPDTGIVSGFTIDGMVFRKTEIDGGKKFVRIIAGEMDLVLGYHWYKKRKESDNGSYLISVFYEDRNYKYLFIKGKAYKYRNNKTFYKAFPEVLQPEIRDYLKITRTKVRTAGESTMKQVLSDCRDICNKPL